MTTVPLGRPRRGPRCVTTGLLLLAALLAPAPAPAQARGGLFRDPADGRLDLSEFLLTHKGFLPTPIVVTEPAVGYGGGLAVAFFSQSIAEGATEGGRYVRPTVLGGAGFYTSDGSYGGGIGAFVPFRRDRFRYLGALGGASLDLDFHGFDPDGPLADDPVPYEIGMLFLIQRLQARVEGTDLFVGAHYEYLRTESTFERLLPAEIPQRDVSANVGGLGASLELDTRDNLLDARRGADVIVSGTWYGPALGGDQSFGKYQVQGLFYWQPPGRWGFGLRADARFASGDPPFFYKPYLSMRGLPALQYANDVTLLGEAEVRFSIDPRWTVLGFGGAGRVGESVGDLGDSPSIGAGGMGFRYLIARQLGLGTGIDLAFGRGGEVAVYLQTGAAWR